MHSDDMGQQDAGPTILGEWGGRMDHESLP